MNITFTKEELTKFASELSDWHEKKTLFVCEHFARVARDEFRAQGTPVDALIRISDEFDSKFPKPDWRSLL
jgi:hypothetical protein